MSNGNPFRATSGVNPPVIVGRDEYIEDFSFALRNGPGTHERISLVVGTRGIGKTVLLNEFGDQALRQGWHVFDETATADYTQRLRDSIYQRIKALGQKSERSLSGLNLNLGSVAGIGATFELAPEHLPAYTLRMAIEDLLKIQPESGVLITIDELHYNVLEETREFGAVVQHLNRDNANIAVAMAGIPSSVKPLLASNEGENPVTFLRRANRIELDRVSDAEVRRGLEEPVHNSEKEWADEALEIAVGACGGYPFMIQLVGDWSFRYAATPTIDLATAEKGIAKAQRKLGQLVHEPALTDLSAIDRTYLLHMSQNDGESSTAEIAHKLGKGAQYANTYRSRLIDAQLIRQTRQGYVDFELPYLREYLREHQASLVLDFSTSD